MRSPSRETIHSLQAQVWCQSVRNEQLLPQRFRFGGPTAASHWTAV